MMRMPLVETRSFTKRFSDSTQKRWFCRFGRKRRRVWFIAWDTLGTGHFYTTTKNKRNTPEKIEIKKYDPVVRKHVAYKEAKIK